ncbi:ABC transporter ATP-binding protein [Peredibacter starrii]|uniref:ABC transporter ATP-binding protein n=1 Tax=Peredibacter starrii TaxID=28202 RepID=A0AAX4HSE2_9BACT|nr:ABC transporter ATP-binding protein [Peredibacter starrii]WPU65925.1 ABC transporter ATP-binding protein [Peredibacter starrii]
MSSVEFKNVTKDYQGNVILKNLSFKINDGEFVSFLGPSGCGKTTSLRIVAGLEKNSGGEVSLGGEIISSPEKSLFVPTRERNLGMVFQSYAIWPHMNIFENVAFPLRMKKTSEAEIKKSVEDVLQMVELGGLSERMPSTLSGGQQQRVALARGLVARPKVLLLDEPLSNLDAKLREKMRKDIRQIQQHFKITCIYVTHDQVEAFSMSDRIMIMEKGNILQFATPSEIRANPVNDFVKDFIS